MNAETSLSSRPYFARAAYDWIEDNRLTPYILVDATLEEVEVPRQYVNEGRIVLNISSTAVRELSIDQNGVTFLARFGGVPMRVTLPMIALLAVYARENGKGVFFERDGDLHPPPSAGNKKDGQKPSLKIVK